MAEHQIKHRVAVTVRLLWITTEHIIDLPPMVNTTRHLAVGVVIRFSSRIGKSFKLETIGRMNESIIGIGIAARLIEVDF